MCRTLSSVVLLLFLLRVPTLGQDSLQVDLRQADSLFMAHNYYLLASSMNIEATRAQELQAGLYPNPVVTTDFNFYDPENRKLLHTGNSGQKFIQFEQLILLGGKRKAEIELAKTSTAIAELEFQNLIRQLRYRLHTNLFITGQQKILLGIYNNQLQLIDSLLVSNQQQADKGNIPVKDLVRLKGAYLKLNNDRAEIYKQYYQAQSELHTLLQSDAVIDFRFGEADIRKYIRSHSLEDLREAALTNRPDLLIEEKNRELAQQYFDYQRKLKVPDLTLAASYDQRSGAFVNQVNVGVSLPLPLWNRNQGNIKAAKYRIRESDYKVDALKNSVMSELRSNHVFYRQTVSEYEKANLLYDRNFEITLKGMTDNFRKRNVSIVEFVDFFEAYNEVLTELVRIKIQLVTSGEELNLLTGKDVY